MDKETLIEVLSSWNFWEKDMDAGVRREAYLERMKKLLRTGQIVAVTGVRRAGKSTLLKQFIKDQIGSGKGRTSFLYVNFEEPKFTGMLSVEFLQQIYEAYLEIVKPEGKPYVLLDEVHTIPQWERFARALHEKGEAHVIVSGSTSRLMSKELGTLLTGRWVGLDVHPLTFEEFLHFRKVEIKGRLDMLNQKVRIKQLLREYLEFGGFPLVALKGEREEILGKYFEDIITRDIGERHKIRNTEKLKALAKYYLTNFSSPISYRKAAKFIGLSLDSVERFSAYMTEAFLVSFVPLFSYSLKEQEVNPRKVYGVDSGVMNTVSFRFSENIGRLYENIVFLSLARNEYEIYYHKGKGECDFVVKEGQKITQAIQVCYQVHDAEDREIRGLIGALKTYKLKNGVIITESREGRREIEGKVVRYIPLWKWLLRA